MSVLVIAAIDEAACKFQAKTGVKPTHVFMHHTTFNSVANLAENFLKYPTSVKKPEICGLQVLTTPDAGYGEIFVTTHLE